MIEVIIIIGMGVVIVVVMVIQRGEYMVGLIGLLMIPEVAIINGVSTINKKLAKCNPSTLSP